MPCLAPRLVRRDENQITIVQLAPAAHIRISKLEEKNRPIMIAMPAERWDPFLSWVNLHERFWMMDAKSKKALYVNEAYQSITGRSCQSLMDDPFSYEEVIYPD